MNERVAYVYTQTVACLCEMEAMKAANAERDDKGHMQAYREQDFTNLIDKYELGCNTVMFNLYER